MTETTTLAVSIEGSSAADAFDATTHQTRVNPADLQRHWMRKGSHHRKGRHQRNHRLRTMADKNKQASQPVQGQASWYGPGHYLNKTASGEILKKGTMTAAHSSLPMGTNVRVTRLDNNKTVTVVMQEP